MRLKYSFELMELEDEMIAEYVLQKQASGDTREVQDIAVEYNDNVIYPDKVRINLYYLDKKNCQRFKYN